MCEPMYICIKQGFHRTQHMQRMQQTQQLLLSWHQLRSLLLLRIFLHSSRMLDRRRRYLFGSNSITYKYTNDKIKQTSRARLPENPEVNHTGHPNIQFLVYHETTTTTTTLLKNTQRNKYKKKPRVFGLLRKPLDVHATGLFAGSTSYRHPMLTALKADIHHSQLYHNNRLAATSLVSHISCHKIRTFTCPPLVVFGNLEVFQFLTF